MNLTDTARYDTFKSEMDLLEDIKAAKDVVSALLKARKTFRMYPENNPMYAKIVNDTYSRFEDFFVYKDELTFKIKQHALFCDSEQVYHNPQKEDSLSIFLFKDGLREITFKKGLTREELEGFLKILTVDFDREVLDDDVVTLLWEKDMQNIKYVVDESFLTDDEEDYETKTVNETLSKPNPEDELTRAYADAFNGEKVEDISIVPLTDKDLHTLVKELEKDSYNKIAKLVGIVFEMLYQAESAHDYEDAVHFLRGSIEFSMRSGDLATVIHILKRTRDFMNSQSVPSEIQKYLNLVFTFVCSDTVVKLLGEFLDSGIEIDERLLDEYFQFLDHRAIQPFITILGELKTIPGRKNVINSLIILGKKDILAVSKGLYDSRWYVVRNIIYILGKIGDKRAVDYLIKTVSHSDLRVRKEVIKALGGLSTPSVLQTLRDCLDDPDTQIRTAAARSLGSISSPAAKNIILQKISPKSFEKNSFAEKKDFYEVLSHWKDAGVTDFLIKTLKKNVIFGRALNFENKACAAYCLGLIGSKEALPLLYKMQDSKNRLLREYADLAIKRIEYGK